MVQHCWLTGYSGCKAVVSFHIFWICAKKISRHIARVAHLIIFACCKQASLAAIRQSLIFAAFAFLLENKRKFPPFAHSAIKNVFLSPPALMTIRRCGHVWMSRKSNPRIHIFCAIEGGRSIKRHWENRWWPTENQTNKFCKWCFQEFAKNKTKQFSSISTTKLHKLQWWCMLCCSHHSRHWWWCW